MKKKSFTLAGAALWLIIWQIGAMLLDQKILLVTPVDTAKRLVELVPQWDFISSVLFSAGRILLGFAAGLAAGTALAVLAGRFAVIKRLFAPLISAMKSVPVASFTILALIWVSSKNLSALVSFLICVPVVYSNMLEGIQALDPGLSEMARVFDIPAGRRFAGVYLSQLMPYFKSASKLSIGLCWKSGVAAEVIGIPDGSLGEKLFMAKVYLETADLFAWTVVIILLSWCCEKLFMLIIDLLVKRSGHAVMFGRERGGENISCEITAENIEKSYGKTQVLNGFSYAFPAGKTTAVMGASGCGKSTLLSVLMGMLKADSGEVTVTDGARISAVFQEDRLCENLTVSANIRLVIGGRRKDNAAISEKIEKALMAVGLSGCEKKRARELSGGMKRRVSLLRALLSDYDALFLDEPFKGLDESTKKAVMEFCKEKLRGKTVIMVTHDISECEFLADEIIRL